MFVQQIAFTRPTIWIKNKDIDQHLVFTCPWRSLSPYWWEDDWWWCGMNNRYLASVTIILVIWCSSGRAWTSTVRKKELIWAPRSLGKTWISSICICIFAISSICIFICIFICICILPLSDKREVADRRCMVPTHRFAAPRSRRPVISRKSLKVDIWMQNSHWSNSATSRKNYPS